MLASRHLGMLAVSVARIFPLDFVLGKGPGCIEYQGMLVKGKLVMLGFSVSQLFTLTMGGGRDYYEWARIVGGN